VNTRFSFTQAFTQGVCVNNDRRPKEKAFTQNAVKCVFLFTRQLRIWTGGLFSDTAAT
jgi:hypothetical protein